MSDIAASLAELSRLGSALADDVVEREALALVEQLERSELNVLVVGQFKRGKSSVINALLHEDLMPAGALPLTGVATAVRYGSPPSITVTLRNGESRTASIDELAMFVSERTNPRNTLGVARVDVVRPEPVLEGIALFDTPGIGSIFGHNTEAARAVLPRADAAVLVVGPEPPIGAEELAYASDVAESSVRLFVLFNKADLAGPALDELLDFTRSTIAEINGSAEIFPVSAMKARSAQLNGVEEPDFLRFVRALRGFVDEHGSDALATSAWRRARLLYGRASTLVQLRAQAIALPRREREELRATLEAAILRLDDRVRLLELAVDDDVRRLRLRLEDTLDRRYDGEQAQFVALGETIAREPSKSARRSALETALSERAHQWRRAALEQARSEIAENSERYGRLLSEIEQSVIGAGCEVLHVDSAAFVPREIAFEPAKLTLPVSLDATTGLEIVRDAVIDLLPRPLRERALRRRIISVLESEFDALRGKLRYGIAHDLEPWRHSVHRTIRSSLDGTRSAVLSAIPTEAPNEGEDAASKSLALLEEQLALVWDGITGVAR